MIEQWLVPLRPDSEGLPCIHVLCMNRLRLRNFDIPVYCTQTGWMMWNWLVTGLATGATIVTYDGSPFIPDGNVLFDLCDEVG